MATYPNLTKGEGLVRSYELLACLTEDSYNSFEQLNKEKDSQYLRRNVVRTTFSFIEGIIQILKFELKAEFRLGRTKIVLTEKEKEILDETRVVGDKKIPWNIPLDVNFRKTVTLVKKVWTLEKTLINFSSNEYKTFLFVKNTRNRLTHPRTFYDVEISEQEIVMMAKTFQWLKASFWKIMQAKIEFHLSTLPVEFRDQFRASQLKENNSKIS